MDKLASRVVSSMIDKIASDNENNTELINLIRDDIVGEYNAIRQYEEHAESFPDGKIKEVLLDIANEEKVHIGELQKLLDILSPEDNDLAEDGEREVEGNMNEKSASEIVIGMIEKEASFGSVMKNYKNLMTGAAVKEQAAKVIKTTNKSDEFLNKAKKATNPEFAESYTNIAKNLSNKGNEERKIMDGIKRKQSLARTGTGAVAGAGVGAVVSGIKNNVEKKKQSKLQAEEGL